MPAAITLCSTLVISLLIVAHGHGRLTKPTPRNGGANPSGTENAPATINDASATNFICRHSVRNAQVPFTDVAAGGTLTLQWTTPAAHVGDCAIYITYDVDQDLVNQRYFKIANLPDCKSQQNTDVTITIPDFLPAGQAIMRWDWYALHVRPQIEFYVQCVDIQVTGSSNSVFASQISAYTITNPPIYPSTGNEGVGFRNAFNPNSEQYMTGPACSNGITINNCPLTAVGTTGNTRDGGVIGGPGPSPIPTIAPSPAPSPSPTPSPAPSPSPNNGDCEVHQIVAGETLTTIAALFTNAGMVVNAQQICNFNGLSDCNLIFVGEFLVIPYAGSLCGASTSSSSTTTMEITTTAEDEPTSGTLKGHSTRFLFVLSLPLFFNLAFSSSLIC